MPLSDPAPRQLLHLRDIELRGFQRDDGLFDIEARLTDTKSYAFANIDRGEVRGRLRERRAARVVLHVDRHAEALGQQLAQRDVVQRDVDRREDLARR